jgi:hypothetical protein
MKAQVDFVIDSEGNLTVAGNDMGGVDLATLQAFLGQEVGIAKTATPVVEKHIPHQHVMVGGKEHIRWGI